jgi:serine/threonine protein kinase
MWNIGGDCGRGKRIFGGLQLFQIYFGALSRDVSNRPTFDEIVSVLSESTSWLVPGTDVSAFQEFKSRLCVPIEADTIKYVNEGSLLSRFLVSLSRYDLGERLGSNGSVRGGVDLETGDTVAIKTTEIRQKGGLFKTSDLIHLFLELQIQASLQDFWFSNEAELLLPLKKFVFDGENIHIVMPKMPNGDVDNPKIVWTPTAKSKTIDGIATGMSVLHRLGIIHHDLKGQNVLLNSRNEPVIADFGFAQFRGDGKPQLGSSLYLAPELLTMYRCGRYLDKFRNAEAQDDPSVDVYAYGVLVWTLFDDERNYVSGEDEYLDLVMRGWRLPRPDDVLDSLWSIIEDCWSANPSLRPSFDSILSMMTSKLDWVVRQTDEPELQRYIERIFRRSVDRTDLVN